MKNIRSIASMDSYRIPPRLKLVATRLGSLLLLFQRMPVVQFLFPEASFMGSATVANSVSLAVTTVVGLGAFDSVAGQTTIDEKQPLVVKGADSSVYDTTLDMYAINVPATVSAPLNFEFTCTTAPSRPKSYSTTALPAGLSLSWINTATAVYNDFITGTPAAAGKYPVTITVWRSANNTSDSVSQRFNIYVLGFTTQPAASTTINSGQTTTLTCVAAGNPVGTTLHPGNGTLTYQWYQGLSGDTSTPVGTTNSSTPGFTTPTLTSSTNYWVRIKSVLGASTVYANSTTAAVTVNPVSSPFDTWASVLPAGQRGANQTPMGDGVTNLEKFAFNLNPLAPDVRHLTVGANNPAGLPGATLAAGKLRIEFLRRIAGTNPGISYTVQFGSDLAGWADIATGTPAGVAIDGTWERVTVDDPTGGSQRFGRVKVVQTP